VGDRSWRRMDTGWGASWPNRPMMIRSVLLDGPSSEEEGMPFRSMNTLEVMTASDVDFVVVVSADAVAG